MIIGGLLIGIFVTVMVILALTRSENVPAAIIWAVLLWTVGLSLWFPELTHGLLK